MKLPDLQGWLPVSTSLHGNELRIDWCRFGTRRFTRSFFEGTVQEAMREPFNLLFRHQLPLDSLMEFQARYTGIAPSGFIFHMSRCGSTLVSRMLAALPEHIVLSEPPPLDALLRIDSQGADDAQRIAWVQGWMNAMGQPRNGETRLFVKLDAWHIFQLPLLRRAFPDTPWIFLYRDPVEVLVSALRSPGSHHTPGVLGLTLPGVDPAAVSGLTPAEYAAHSLAGILRSALEYLGPFGGRAFDYRGLPAGVITEIAPHFGLQLSPAQIAEMNAITAFHAKTPSFYFEPDAELKQQQATAVVREVSEKYLRPLYLRLQQL